MVNRRRLLLGTATTGVVGLAGCLERFSTDDGDDNGSSSSDQDDADDSESNGGDEGSDDGSNGGDEGSDDDGSNGDEDPAEPWPDNGAVVFIYDDGPMEDYTQAFPAHQAFDAPASTGIVTEWIGRQDFNDNDWMDVHHLEELADAGWEITSHTIRHASLGTFELVEDAAPTDTHIYPDSLRHGFHPDRNIEITDGERTVERTVVGTGEDAAGRYIELDETLDASFAAGETIERYTADEMHAILGESQRQLEDLGFEVTTLLAPYDEYDDWALEFVPEYYDGVANAQPSSRINDPDTFDPYQTRRDYFIEFTSPEPIIQDIDKIANEGLLGIFGAHTFKEEITQDGIRQILEWVHARDVEVLTLRDAISRLTT